MDRVPNGVLRRQRRKSRDGALIKAEDSEPALGQNLPAHGVDRNLLQDEMDYRRFGGGGGRRAHPRLQQNDRAVRTHRPHRFIGLVGRMILSLWAVCMLAALFWRGVQELLPAATQTLNMLSSMPSSLDSGDNSTDFQTRLGKGGHFLAMSDRHIQHGLRPEVKYSGVANMSAFQREVEEYASLVKKADETISPYPLLMSLEMITMSTRMEVSLLQLYEEIEHEDRLWTRILSWIFPPALSTIRVLTAVESLRDDIPDKLNTQIDHVQVCINDLERLTSMRGSLGDHNLAKIAELEQQAQDDRSIVEKLWQRDRNKERARKLLIALEKYAAFFEACRQPLDDIASTLTDTRKRLLKTKQAVSEWPSTQTASRDALIVHKEALIRVLNMVQDLQALASRVSWEWKQEMGHLRSF